MGSDSLLTLSRRTNEYFTKFVASWLKSDSIASHFVFELGGFEFLLDTIGKKDEEEEKSPTDDKAAEQKSTDFFDMLYDKSISSQPEAAEKEQNI